MRKEGVEGETAKTGERRTEPVRVWEDKEKGGEGQAIRRGYRWMWRWTVKLV
jgi:hypothetical protein